MKLSPRAANAPQRKGEQPVPLRANRKIWENAISLYTNQAASYLVPLALLPYLARVLGSEEFGMLAFVEAFANTVSLILEYGFGLSATRSVSGCRELPLERSRILGAVLGAQTLMALGATLVTVLWMTASHSKAEAVLLPYALIGGIAKAVNPFWYFQARERIRAVTVVFMTSNILLVVFVLSLVHSPGQVWLVMAIKAGFVLAAALASLVFAYRDMPFVWPSWGPVLQVLREGWPLFLFRGSAMLYGTANVLLLGFLASPGIVGWFAGAEKISRAAVGCVLPLAQGFYPRINYMIRHDPQRAYRVTFNSARLTIALGVAAGAALWVASPLLIRISLGPGFERSVPVLRVLALIPAVVSISCAFGPNLLIPLKMDRQFTTIVFLAGIANLLLAAPLTRALRETGMAASAATAESLAAAGVVVLCWRKGIISAHGFTQAAIKESSRLAGIDSLQGSSVK